MVSQTDGVKIVILTSPYAAQLAGGWVGQGGRTGTHFRFKNKKATAQIYTHARP